MNRQLSEHFNEREFVCPCCGQLKVDDKLVQLLERIREHFRRPVIVNSGYRCDLHNKEVGGTPYSMHKQGLAADIDVVGVSPAKVQQYLRDHEGGLGKYTRFTHVDVRGYKARWRG